MARPLKSETIESRWYDIFATWRPADREIALKVLGTLHRNLPGPQPAKPNEPKQGALL